MLCTGHGRARNRMIWYANEKINLRIQVEQKILACAYITKQFRRLVQEHERNKYNVTANVVGRHTLPNKKEIVMYISKREEKRRLQKLWHKSAEEQMQEYYLQQKKRAYTLGTQIERNAFEIGKGKRMQKKARNSFSKEEFGTCGTYIATKRFSNSRLTCVCKSRNLY